MLDLMRIRLAAALAAIAIVAGIVAVPAARPVAGAAALPAVPASWPFASVEVGLADSPGGAAALRASAPFGLRYQYLAGGVNTGSGWATWNTNGAFVTWYVQDSVANGMVPVFPYYMMLQSLPATGSSESAKDLSNLRNTSTMGAYWADVRLFFQKAAAGSADHPIVLHVEPDLWGYIEQAAANNAGADVPAAVASSGDADLAGLPNTAAGFARAFVRLRDKYAPNVLLAYHLSVWGTMFDLHASQTSDAQTDTLAAKAAGFYTSLGADFDLAFTDLSDRDSGFYQYVYGDGGAAWWNASDFPRYGRFIAGFVAGTGKRVVVWQIPMGNTVMRATNDTWGHYADNRPEWFLSDITDGHLASWRDDGVIGLLFGGGASGTTCACDATGDGVTNPAASGTHTRASLSADDDGGYLRDRIGAYYAAGGLALDAGGGSDPTPPPGGDPTPPPGGDPTPPPAPTPAPVQFATSGLTKPQTVTRRHDILVKAHVSASSKTRVLVDVEIYGPKGHLVKQHTWTVTLSAGVRGTFKFSWHVKASRHTGRYTVKIGVFKPGWAGLLRWNNRAAVFKVR
jgi:hypothetical protein